MKRYCTAEEAHRSPFESRVSMAFIQAMREAAKRGKVPPYIPNEYRGWMLLQRPRHAFYER